jgi:hypothetical protein
VAADPLYGASVVHVAVAVAVAAACFFVALIT